jgi:hypothetical protein
LPGFRVTRIIPPVEPVTPVPPGLAAPAAPIAPPAPPAYEGVLVAVWLGIEALLDVKYGATLRLIVEAVCG